ncbi:hypothetical protein A8B75_11100 [Sphingomonadales bacterium EhC05]|jgi:hypothetical protein|nr:hypothetical protein A8B75_11100 [Sphingomonadales bacterium EhC05]
MLQDLSISGFLLSCPAQLNQHKPLMIKLPGLELLTARIMWSKDGKYGCKFDRELYPAVFDHIVRESKR